MTIETSRLLLRQWKDDDIVGFTAMSQDSRVMEFLPYSYSDEESAEVVLKCRKAIEERGWGFWAVEVKDSTEFVGSVGLCPVTDNMPIPQSLEVGWRLAWEHWGKGYATEAAMASIAFAFDSIGNDEVVAFTAVQNIRSRRVMEKMGMSEMTERFTHPDYSLSAGLSEHVLYEIRRECFYSRKV